MPWEGDVHSSASTAAARAYNSIPGSGLQASLRSSCPALGGCVWLLERLRYIFPGIKGAINVK